jgi:sn-glycerol 3-phosphate transport system permease protein
LSGSLIFAKGVNFMEKRKWQAFLFLLPSVFFFAVFSYWPLLQNLYLSFFSWNMVSPNMKFVGLDNYVSVLGSEELIKILVNTVVFVAIMLVLNFVLPYLFSFVLGHLIERGKGFYRSALFMPATLSLAVASILFLWIYNPLAGPLSIVLSWFDVESPRWFKENWLVIFAICTIIGWKVFGYNLIVMLAAMLAVPKEMIEAAKLENASNWQIFKQIIVPMTSSTAIYVFTITVVFGLQYVLVPVNMLTQGGPDQGSSNLVYIIYQYAFVFFQTGKSAAFAIITMVCYIAFLLFRNKYLEKKVYYEN